MIKTGLQISGPHPRHIPKGAFVSIGFTKGVDGKLTEKPIDKMKQGDQDLVLITHLNSARRIVDVANKEAVATILAEVKADAERDAKQAEKAKQANLLAAAQLAQFAKAK